MELTHLKFSGKLFVNESLSHENQQLAYKYRKLKIARKIYSTSFYNNYVNIKLSEYSNPVKIFDVRDTENLMGTWRIPKQFLRIPKEFFQLNYYIFFVVILLLLLSEPATGGVLWKKAFLEISRISRDSACVGVSFQLSCRPDNCGYPIGFAGFLRAPILKNIGERVLLYAVASSCFSLGPFIM